ncbi:MAG: response regulator [Nitrospinae bacterium]|nr:response regulator [Nitrospinota bacterium]
MEKKVLIVDDNPNNRQSLKSEIEKMLGYACYGAVNGMVAMNIVRKYKFQVILLDSEMPVLDGFGFLKAYREARGFDTGANIIMVTPRHDRESVEKAMRYGVCDFLVEPFPKADMVEKVSRWINAEVESSWSDLDPEQEQILRFTMQTLNRAKSRAGGVGAGDDYSDFVGVGKLIVDAAGDSSTHKLLDAMKEHDDYTFVHSLRTGIYLSLFALSSGFTRDEAETMTLGGVFHDIGKARIPLEVLNKGGGFEPDEWLVMKEHVKHSVDVLASSKNIAKSVIDIAWCHHERLDGTGYPRGLKGSEIGTLPRMASIVDAYVALTDRRVYKRSFSQEMSFRMLEAEPDHFDQELVAEFKRAVCG